MPSVNNPDNVKDRTSAVYQQFNAAYDGIYGYGVDQDTYDYTLGYFEKTADSKEAAAAFTDNLFRIAANFQSNGENITVQDLLQQINNSQGITIDKLMAYWLNQIQSTSTLLGTVRKFSSNYYVTRTILD